MANKESVIACPVGLRPLGYIVQNFYTVLLTEKDSLLSELCLQVTVRKTAKNSNFFILMG